MNGRIYFVICGLVFLFFLPGGALAAPPCPESPSAEGVLGVVQDGRVDWCFNMEVRGALHKKSASWGFVFSDKIELVRVVHPNEHWYQLGKLEGPPSREGGSDSVVGGKKILGKDIKLFIEENLRRDTSTPKKKYSIKIKEGEGISWGGYIKYVGTLVLSEYTPTPAVTPPVILPTSDPHADVEDKKVNPSEWLKTNCGDKSKQILGLRLHGKVHWCQTPDAKGQNPAREWGITIDSGQSKFKFSLGFQLSPFAELQEGAKWYPLQTIHYANNGRINEKQKKAIFSEKLKASEVVAHITKQLTTGSNAKVQAMIEFAFTNKNKLTAPSFKQGSALILSFGTPRDYSKGGGETFDEEMDKLFIIIVIVLSVFTLCGLMYWCYVKDMPPCLWLKNKVGSLRENQAENKDHNERKMEKDFDECKEYYLKQYTDENKKVAINALYQAALAHQRISQKKRKREESEKGISKCLVLMKKASKDLPFQVLERQQLHQIETFVKQLPTEVSQRMLPLFQAIEACVNRLFFASGSTMEAGAVGFKITKFAAIYEEKSAQYPVLIMLYYVILRASKAFDSEYGKNNKNKTNARGETAEEIASEENISANSDDSLSLNYQKIEGKLDNILHHIDLGKKENVQKLINDVKDEFNGLLLEIDGVISNKIQHLDKAIDKSNASVTKQNEVIVQQHTNMKKINENVMQMPGAVQDAVKNATAGLSNELKVNDISKILKNIQSAEAAIKTEVEKVSDFTSSLDSVMKSKNHYRKSLNNIFKTLFGSDASSEKELDNLATKVESINNDSRDIFKKQLRGYLQTEVSMLAKNTLVEKLNLEDDLEAIKQLFSVSETVNIPDISGALAKLENLVYWTQWLSLSDGKEDNFIEMVRRVIDYSRFILICERFYASQASIGAKSSNKTEVSTMVKKMSLLCPEDMGLQDVIIENIRHLLYISSCLAREQQAPVFDDLQLLVDDFPNSRNKDGSFVLGSTLIKDIKLARMIVIKDVQIASYKENKTVVKIPFSAKNL